MEKSFQWNFHCLVSFWEMFHLLLKKLSHFLYPKILSEKRSPDNNISQIVYHFQKLFFRCGHNRIRFSAIISKTLHENLTLVWLYRIPSTNVYNLFNTVPIIALQNSNGFLTFASAACTPAGATKDSQRMVENTSKPMPWNVILAPLEWALHDGDKPLANRQSWNNSFSFRILNVQQTNCLSSETWVV